MPKDAETGLRYPWEEPPAFGEVIEVVDGVLWTRLPLPMKLVSFMECSNYLPRLTLI